MADDPLLISGNSIGEVHNRIIAALIKEGCNNELQTEDNEYTWEYPGSIIAHIRYPGIEPFKSVVSPFSQRYIDEYRYQMCSITPKRSDGKGFIYTYGNRSLDFPICDPVAKDNVRGDGDGQGIDQLRLSVIDRLIKHPSSRRAVVVTWNPVLDIGEGDPPCIDVLHFLLRDEVLSLRAFIRSNDMLLAWPNNAYGLQGILDFTVRTLGETSDKYSNLRTGPITTISSSAHLYPVRDANVLRVYHGYLLKEGILRL